MSISERFPYHVTIYRMDWDVIEYWCNEYIGEFEQKWYKLGVDPARYVVVGDYSTKWFFANEKDAMLFALRWS